MPLTPEQATERRKIMDRGTNMLDAIAKTKGENDPMFWSTMRVMLEQVDEFDRRYGLKKFG